MTSYTIIRKWTMNYKVIDMVISWSLPLVVLARDNAWQLWKRREKYGSESNGTYLSGSIQPKQQIGHPRLDPGSSKMASIGRVGSRTKSGMTTILGLSKCHYSLAPIIRRYSLASVQSIRASWSYSVQPTYSSCFSESGFLTSTASILTALFHS